MTEFDKVIPPGGVGKVTVSVDTTHFDGHIAKSVRVTTNDPANARFSLQVAADVVTVVAVSPTNFPVLQGRAEELKPVELTIASADGKPFDVVGVEADPKLTVAVTSAVREPSGHRKSKRPQQPAGAVATGSARYLVTIAAKPDVPVGRSIALVTLTTSNPRAPRVPIRVNLGVFAEIQVAPERLNFRVAPPAEAQHVKIRKLTGDGLAIVGIETSDPDFSVASTTVIEGREYDLAVRYAGRPERGVVNGRLTVRTNEPRQSTIVIPLLGKP